MAHSRILAIAQPVAINNASASDPIGDVLRSAAIAYYKMDEVSGNRYDSKNSFDLVEVNNGNSNLPPPVTPVASATGKIGLCANTVDDPTNPSILYNGNVVADLSTGFFVALWVKINTWDVASLGLQSSDPFVLDGLDAFSGALQPKLPVVSSGVANSIYLAVMEFEEWDNTKRVPLTDTNWHLVICWRDPAEVPLAYHMLVDNTTEIVKTKTGQLQVPLQTTGIPVSSTGIEIGDPNFNNTNDAMFIDEVLFAHGVPTQAMKDYLWNGGAGRTLYP